MSFRLWKGYGRPKLWNVEWNREGEHVHLWTITSDMLDELRHVLGVGMGDCDHCPAWKPYMESNVKKAQGKNLISYDMTHLRGINTTAYREICERLVKLENDERLEGVESEQDILSQHMIEIDLELQDLKEEVDLIAFIEAYARGRRLLAQDGKDETNQSGIGSNKTT